MARPCRHIALWFLAAAIAVPLAGCGNADEDDGTTATADSVVESAPNADPIVDPEPGNPDEMPADPAEAAFVTDPPETEAADAGDAAGSGEAPIAEPVLGEAEPADSAEREPALEASAGDPSPDGPPVENGALDVADAALDEPPLAAAPAGAAAPADNPDSAEVAADAGLPEAVSEDSAVPHLSEPIEPDPAFLTMVEAGDLDNGRRQLLRCGRCHSIREDDFEAERMGPPLFDVIGAEIGRVEFFAYSDAMQALDDGLLWTVGRLDAFITDPTETLPGTTMEVGAVADEQDRADLIAYLMTLAPEPEPEAGDPEAVAALMLRISEADTANGQALSDALCARCHSFAAGGETIIGPNLHNVVGRLVGDVDAFTYSASMRSLNEEGAAWSYLRLDEFLENPVLAIPGTRMGFSGVADAEDRAAIIAYLRTLSDAPLPLNNAVAAATDPNGNGLLPLAFTQEQVEAGREAYGREDCLSCHGRALTGVVDVREAGVGMGTALVGLNFENRWFEGPVLDLFRYTQRTMPIGEAGALSDETYILILAYILSENGFDWGETPLPTDREALGRMGFYQLP